MHQNIFQNFRPPLAHVLFLHPLHRYCINSFLYWSHFHVDLLHSDGPLRSLLVLYIYRPTFLEEDNTQNSIYYSLSSLGGDRCCELCTRDDVLSLLEESIQSWPLWLLLQYIRSDNLILHSKIPDICEPIDWSLPLICMYFCMWLMYIHFQKYFFLSQ